jgi:penicillin-insensitive murein DD-endopeptidase
MLDAYRVAALMMLSAALATLPTTLHAETTESQCFGTVSRGRIENAVKLPSSGPNFTSYSNLAAMAGRTYVHSKVADVIVAAYAALAAVQPSIHYVYGETGLAKGGLFRPHRTHQNGTSVDFFVPVRDREGKSVALPTNVTNKFGYEIEFDGEGVYSEYTIDFEATAEHLHQLNETAKAKGIGIALVIFDDAYLPKLFATRRGPFLKQNLKFMKAKPWVRHDEHYHVDFAVPCKAEAPAK